MSDLFILEESYETVKVYKPVETGSGGWDSASTTSSWEYVQDVRISIEPTTPADSILNDQNYQGGVYWGMLPIEYSGVLVEGYGIMSIDNTSYIVVGKPKIFKTILPHVACVLKSRQFVVS